MGTTSLLSTSLERWGMPLILLALALLVRLPGLAGFITFDEARWIDRSRWFAVGLLFPEMSCPAVEYGREFETQGLGCTLQIGYPGATTMWAGMLGLLLHYREAVEPTGQELSFFLKWLPIYKLNTAVIAPGRLPFALMGAFFVPFFYWLVRRLFTFQIAFIAALIIALHPFHIALSRIIHHDAFNAAFMALSLLTLVGYWLRRWPWYWLLGSAVLGGLALLSKQVGWFMLPYVGALMGLTWYYRRQGQPEQEPGRAVGRRLIIEACLWGVGAGLIFILFFPAMWVMPWEVIKVIFSASTALAEEGHIHYFLGQVTDDPGLLFYPLGWLLHATPVEVAGLLAAGAVVGWRLSRERGLKQRLLAHPVELALAVFVVLLLLFVSVSNKKLVRYFLPAFPVIDIFVAWGLLWLLARIQDLSGRLGAIGSRRWMPLGLALIILPLQGRLVLGHYPYYFTYHNPLFGSNSEVAQWMTIVGWGEGIEEAADYLNRLPEAKSLTVVSEWFCSVLRPFFTGRTYCLNSNAGGFLAADYIVYYYNVTQRQLQEMAQWRYFTRHAEPVHRLTIEELDYVVIYQSPVRQPVDQKTNRLPGVFTALGYNLAPNGQLTLFWQNIELGQRQLMVGLAPTRGVYPIGGTAVNAPRLWLPCQPDPAFIPELQSSGAIIESRCSLSEIAAYAGLYDLQLAVADSSSLTPVSSSLLGVFTVSSDGLFEAVELKPVLKEEER